MSVAAVAKLATTGLAQALPVGLGVGFDGSIFIIRIHIGATLWLDPLQRYPITMVPIPVFAVVPSWADRRTEKITSRLVDTHADTWLSEYSKVRVLIREGTNQATKQDAQLSRWNAFACRAINRIRQPIKNISNSGTADPSDFQWVCCMRLSYFTHAHYAQCTN